MIETTPGHFAVRRRVAIVGTLPALRHGLASALRAAGLAVVAGDELAAATVAIVGVRLDDRETPDDVPRARRVVALLESPDPEAYVDALASGAVGAAWWGEPLEELVAVVEAAVHGRTRMPESVARALCNGRLRTAPALDPSQASWLRELCRGTTVAELAARANYSEREVHRRLRVLYDRMGVRTRAEALVVAAKCGLAE